MVVGVPKNLRFWYDVMKQNADLTSTTVDNKTRGPRHLLWLNLKEMIMKSVPNMLIGMLMMPFWAAAGTHQAGMVTPKIIPHILAEQVWSPLGVAPGDELWLELSYRVSPGGIELFHEFGEKVWWIQDQAVVMLGATGLPLPHVVRDRATAYLHIYFGGEELLGSPFLLHPQRDAVGLKLGAEGIRNALNDRLVSMDASYLSEVANYLAQNLSALTEIVAGSYSVQSFGTVIDDAGRWVGGDVDIGTVAEDGVNVSVAGNDGVFINRTGNASIVETSGLNDGFEVGAAEGNGLFVGRAGANGVHVNRSTGDGIYVLRAGSAVDTSTSSHKNGFEVAGAEGYGVYVGDAGIDGLYAGTCRDDGVHISYAMDQGCTVISSGDDGFHVRDAGSPSQYIVDSGVNGVEVGGAQKNGVFVGQSDDDGIFLNRVGEAVGSNTYEVQINGIEIAGVQRNGICVGSADNNGLFVANAGNDGLFINTAVKDGVYVGSAGTYGVDATGDDYGGFFKTTDVSYNYGIYTPDNLYSLNVHAKGAYMQVVQNAGTDPLEIGDVVAFAGVGSTDEADDTPIALVKRATKNSGSAIAGVVFSRYQCDTQVTKKSSVAPDESQDTGERAHSLHGPAQPNDALLLVTHGLARVKASAMDQSIEIGDPLAWNIDSGRVIPIKDMIFHKTPGLTRAFATALEPLTSGEDQIYVFVSCY